MVVYLFKIYQFPMDLLNGTAQVGSYQSDVHERSYLQKMHFFQKFWNPRFFLLKNRLNGRDSLAFNR